MPDYPPQVESFHDAMRRLRGVADVTTGLTALGEFDPQHYSLPGEFGDLPHALLRRTGGALPGEMWANTEFLLTRDDAGWLTLEFLAWWVRDLSRSGELIQLRPQALPPHGFDVQLGTTLKFIIDHLCQIEGDDLGPMLEMMQERADGLNREIDDYAAVLGDVVRK